jgi:hypothetical protein
MRSGAILHILVKKEEAIVRAEVSSGRIFFEHMDKSNWLDDENLIQVVGHTQLNYHPASVGSRLYCLDCREPFYIDSEGVIRSWQTDDDIMTKYNILAI